MRSQPAFAASALAITLVLAACSPAPGTPPASAPETPAPAPQAPPPASPPTTAPPPSATGSKVLGLEGLADLRIGQPVPVGSRWAARGAQASDSCTTLSSPDYSGVYAIVTDGKVQRITVGQRSDVKLVEGIGVGATEAQVRQWFAGFREEPHKYVEAPAKYLTAPNAASGDPALRFEIGADGRVSLIHIGMMPVLGYVEGCS